MSSAPSQEVKKIVLAYSGGLDTSVIIQWLQESYRCPVVAFVADVGQGEDLEAVRQKALRTGAAACHVEDLKEEFVRDFVFPMLRAGAVYEGGYLLGTSIARPLIAKAQMGVARRAGADAVAHGATGKGNDQVRFELTYLSIDPAIRIIAPWREWGFKGREDLVAYAKSHGIPVPVTKKKPYSTDRNLLHTSFEGGILEDPWAEAPEDVYVMSVSPEKAPDAPEYAEVDFERGDPVAVNGEPYTPAKLLARLNEIGGAHGVGRLDLVENRFVGIKSRGVYETPGGTILHVARSALESIVLDREVLHLRAQLMPRYAEQVYYGFWFSPEREMIQAAVDEAAKRITGTARVKLFKGSCSAVGRKSPRSLYSPDHATFEADRVYDQRHAEGFIRLNALRLMMRAAVEGKRPQE
ncbi:MAG: argininosuccinate synthase [Candidatus Tectomicrobia bacterium]|nr:argininosuccinate synthase [Candidatus Tectomicrobia bacterium]